VLETWFQEQSPYSAWLRVHSLRSLFTYPRAVLNMHRRCMFSMFQHGSQNTWCYVVSPYLCSSNFVWSPASSTSDQESFCRSVQVIIIIIIVVVVVIIIIIPNSPSRKICKVGSCESACLEKKRKLNSYLEILIILTRWVVFDDLHSHDQGSKFTFSFGSQLATNRKILVTRS